MTPDGGLSSPPEAASWMRRGRRFFAPLLVRHFPPEVPFGFLGQVAPTSAAVELEVHARRMSSDHALATIEGSRAVAEAELLTRSGGAERSQLEVERQEADE